MDYELRRAREKLESEQRERKEKARQKLQRERNAREEASRQQEAIEAARRSSRLEAAEVQLKVDNHAEETLLASRGIVFERILQPVLFQGSGDKIKLPPSGFIELSNQAPFDKGPLHFKLTVLEPDSNANQKSTHSGVMEFTADEGFVALPPHIWDNLNLSSTTNSSLIGVTYTWLQKGKYVKLQSDGNDFFDLPNHKAVLETTLRQHATLSEGDAIAVNHGELTYKLRILELKPSSSVSVLETDIEVDIVDPDPALGGLNSNQHTLKQLLFGKSEAGVVAEGNYDYYKFRIGDASQHIDIKIILEAESDEGDTNIYASRHPLLFPSRHHHQWSSHDIGSKFLILDSLEPGYYSVGVYGFRGTAKYRISVNVVHKPAVSSVTSPIDADSMECGNCRHYIPKATLALHEAYCSRHNVVCKHAGCGVVLRVSEAHGHVHCDHCGAAFQQDEMDKHMKVFHEPLHCPCGVILEKEEMIKHRAETCSLRLIMCRFCGDMVKAGSSAADVRDRLRGLSEHESVCGSRTAQCDSCGRAVMLKEMDIHTTAVHEKS